MFVRLSDVLSSPLLLMCLRGCAELENHLGIAEKSLAEFIIDLAKDKTSVKHFQQVRRRPSLSSPPSTGMYLSYVFCQYSDPRSRDVWRVHRSWTRKVASSQPHWWKHYGPSYSA